MTQQVLRARVLPPPALPGPERRPLRGRLPRLPRLPHLPQLRWSRGSKPPPWFRWTVVALGLGLTCGSATVGLRLLEPWRLRSDTVQVHDISVTAEPGPLARCPRSRLQFVATIATNGRPGRLTATWTRPDGSRTAPQRLRVEEGQDSVQTRVGYTFAGRDPWVGRAVLVVGGDDRGMAHSTVRYLCGSATG